MAKVPIQEINISEWFNKYDIIFNFKLNIKILLN